MVTPTIPTVVPRAVRAGDTVKFKLRFAEYPPSDSWTLTFYISNRFQQKSITATDNGDGYYLVTISTSVSSDMESGEWRYQATVAKAGEVFTLATGHIEVVPGYSALTAGVDDRSLARKMVDAIEDMLPDTAAHDQTSVSVDGYSATFADKADLIRSYRYWKDILEQEKKAERIQQGLGSGNRIKLRFG